MSHPSEPPESINILTLNCWGLKYISTLRTERLDEIGRSIAVANPSPNIVALQECWCQADYQAIRSHTNSILPYGKFYHSGIFGGGLVILAKWPIEESSMYRYSLNGRPGAFYRGDWYVGKGVACARFRYGTRLKEVMEVFCTHLHAPYESEPHDSYACHRTAQAWEIAKLMKGAVERGHLAIGLGDFNMVPSSLAHRLIESYANVKDVWRILHPDSSLGAADHEAEKLRGKPVPDAAYNIRENGVTCDSPLNTWRWTKKDQKILLKCASVTVESQIPDPKGKRLDYIFCGASSINRYCISAAKVGMTQRHPSLGCSLSDHFSVEVILSRTAPSDEAAQCSSDVDLPSPQLPAPLSSSSSDLFQSLVYPILELIQSYTRRQRRQRRLFLSHFLLSLVISTACLTGIWWSPHGWSSFIIALVSTLNLSTGVISGLIGGLFIGSELRALKEFEWEIQNVRGGETHPSAVGERVKGSEETALKDPYRLKRCC